MNIMDNCQCGNIKKKSSKVCRECRLKELGKRRIVQCEKDGSEITTWESIDHVERVLLKRRPHILDVLKGKRKTAYGFKWKYA